MFQSFYQKDEYTTSYMCLTLPDWSWTNLWSPATPILKKDDKK